MSDVTVLRKQVRKFVEEASEKELEIMYHLFAATNKTDWWNEISADHKKAIDEGIAQLENGETIPHKEVMQKYSKWLKKSSGHRLRLKHCRISSKKTAQILERFF